MQKFIFKSSPIYRKNDRKVLLITVRSTTLDAFYWYFLYVLRFDEVFLRGYFFHGLKWPFVDGAWRFHSETFSLIVTHPKTYHIFSLKGFSSSFNRPDHIRKFDFDDNFLRNWRNLDFK